jgi:hypothetical protein
MKRIRINPLNLSGLKHPWRFTCLFWTCVMALAFYTNAFNRTKGHIDKMIPQDCETIVVGKIAGDRYHLNTGKLGMGYCSVGKFQTFHGMALETYHVMEMKKHRILLPTSSVWLDSSSCIHENGTTTVILQGKPEYVNLLKKRDVVRIGGNAPRTIENITYDRDVTIELGRDSRSVIRLPRQDTVQILINDPSDLSANLDYRPYRSCYGLQGHIFTFLYNSLGISDLRLFRILSILLLSLVITCLCYQISLRFNPMFAIVFYGVFLLSPWMATFSGDLFWIAFTWFLPALFGMLLIGNPGRYKLYLPLIFISVLIKCLCGYEYVPTILWFMISFFILDLINTSEKRKRKKLIQMTFITGIISVMAFLTSILIQASVRSSSLSAGLKEIWEQDVMRRTMGGDPANFPPEFRESILASPFTVLKKYIIWETPVISGIPGDMFIPIFLFSLFILLYFLLRRKENSLKEITAFGLFLIAPLTWFVLGKAHSYIHTHLNFVLWYFGFIQIEIYLILKFLMTELPVLFRKYNTKWK